MEDYYIGIDLGGTNIRIGLVDEGDQVGDLVYLSVKEYSSWDELLLDLVSIIKEMEVNRVRAVGVAVAGGVVISKGIVSYSPHLKWIDGQPVRENLAKAIDLPVWMDNDANAVTYGEWMYGAGKGFSSIICITLGSGVGGGIILSRGLHRGEDGLAGEIGHMCVQPNGRPCRCGKKGCLEAYSSGTAISTIYREKDRNGAIDDDIKPLQVYEKATGGDSLALEVFEGFGAHLGIAIANLVNVFSIHHYVITGGESAVPGNSSLIPWRRPSRGIYFIPIREGLGCFRANWGIRQG